MTITVIIALSDGMYDFFVLSLSGENENLRGGVCKGFHEQVW